MATEHTAGRHVTSRRDLGAAPVPPAGPAAAERRRYDWRSDVIGFSGLNIIAGIWLIIAPWVLGYSGRDPRWNDVVFGAIVAVIGLVRVAGGYREAWLSWINAAIGVWIFIAAFAIDHTGRASWNDIILGVIVCALALGSAGSTPRSAASPAAGS